MSLTLDPPTVDAGDSGTAKESSSRSMSPGLPGVPGVWGVAGLLFTITAVILERRGFCGVEKLRLR